MSKSRISLLREQEQAARYWRDLAQALPAGHGIDEICSLLEKMPADQFLSLQAYLKEIVLGHGEVAHILAPLEQEQAKREEAHHRARPTSPTGPDDPEMIAWLEQANQIGIDRIQRELRRALPGMVLECIDEVLAATDTSTQEQTEPIATPQSKQISATLSPNPLFDDLRDRADILEYFQSFDQDEQGRLIWNDGKGKREDPAHILDCLYGSVDGKPPILRHDKQRFAKAVQRFTYPDGPINPKTLSNQAADVRNEKRSPSAHIAMALRTWRDGK